AGLGVRPHELDRVLAALDGEGLAPRGPGGRERVLRERGAPAVEVARVLRRDRRDRDVVERGGEAAVRDVDLVGARDRALAPGGVAVRGGAADALRAGRRAAARRDDERRAERATRLDRGRGG